MKLCNAQGIETFHSRVFCAESFDTGTTKKRAAYTALKFPLMTAQRAEIVPVGDKVPALAGAVPSAAGTRDEKGVFFEQSFERAGKIFPFRLVL